MSVIGISVERARVFSVFVRSGHVVAEAQAPTPATGDRQSAIENMLNSVLPKRMIVPPRVVVAVGPGYGQLKQVEGLPVTRQTKLLSRVLRESPASFFLQRGSRLYTGDVELRSDGTIWAAAFDSAVADDVLAALRKKGLTRVVFVASGAALGVDELVAVSAGTPSATAWRPEPDARTQRVSDRIRLGLATAAFVVCASAALVAPGVRAHRAASRAGIALEHRQQSRREAAVLEANLARVSGELERIKRFESSRGRMTGLLGSLAQVIPESTAIVTMRVDSVEASFVAITPHAADLLGELASVDGVFNPRIVGSVTREQQGIARLERATVRFRRQPEAAKNVPRPTTPTQAR